MTQEFNHGVLRLTMPGDLRVMSALPLLSRVRGFVLEMSRGDCSYSTDERAKQRC